MAKLHLEGGVTFEGTPEEIKAYTDLYVVDAEKAQEKPEPAQSFKEGDIVVITGNTKMRHATQAEREQYEESLKPKLKAGDWVKFMSYKGIVNREDISLNKAYQVFTDTDDELAFVDDAGDRRIQPLKAVDALETTAPQTAFERIGRKEGEFKVGDIVRVIDAEGSELSNGDIGIITEIDDDSVPFFVSVPNKDTAGNYQCLDDIELITPVESRVDVPCA